MVSDFSAPISKSVRIVGCGGRILHPPLARLGASRFCRLATAKLAGSQPDPTDENERGHPFGCPLSFWLRGKDSNQRPSGYEPDELPLLHPAIYVRSLECLNSILYPYEKIKPFFHVLQIFFFTCPTFHRKKALFSTYLVASTNLSLDLEKILSKSARKCLKNITVCGRMNFNEVSGTS